MLHVKKTGFKCSFRGWDLSVFPPYLSEYSGFFLQSKDME